MLGVTTAMLARACRTFMGLAYPNGPETIPLKKRLYYDLPLDQPVTDFLPPALVAREICQELRGQGGQVRGYALRLGSAHFPNLKLKMEMVACPNGPTWVFMVDTHDAFSKDSILPPPDHPDAKAWRALQEINRRLKEQIESALEREELATFNSLLGADLKKSGP